MLSALVLAIGGVSPAQMQANLAAWVYDAVRIVTIYLIAEQAQPDMLIEHRNCTGRNLHGPELSL